MTDTEALDLIERYRLSIVPYTGIGGGWVIEGDDESKDDPEIIELARTRGSLREALLIAKANI